MNKKLRKILYSAVCVFAVLVPYMLLGPMEIYAANMLAFKFGWADFALSAVAVAVAVSLAAGALIALIPDGKAYNAVVNAITAFALMSYVQAMFMNPQLTRDDGNAMDFSVIGSFYYVNLVIWIAGFAAFFIIASLVSKSDKGLFDMIRIGLCGFLCAIQLVAFVSLLLTTDSHPQEDRRTYQLSGDEQFVLSPDDNILVLILDSYSNAYFNYAQEADPQFNAILSDFTYYTNADSVYIPTFPSLAHMLTGGEFYFADSTDAWFHDIWGQPQVAQFYDRLHDSGYRLNLFSVDTHNVVGLYEDVEGKISNAVKAEVRVDKAGLLRLICKMSAYRYVPYVLKPLHEVLTPEYDALLYYDHKESVFNNEDYLAALEDGGFTVGESAGGLSSSADGVSDSAGDARNGSGANAGAGAGNVGGVINITHIAGMHNSVEITESLDDQNNNRDIIEAYLNSIKACGKYDESTIIITADHGKYGYGEYQPILMVKLPGESHEEMAKNAAPVSHNDFMATMLYLTGNEYSEYGKSIFEYEEGEERTRTLHLISESDKTIKPLEYVGDIEALITSLSEYNYGE